MAEWLNAIGGGMGIAAIITALAALIPISQRTKAAEKSSAAAASAASMAVRELRPDNGTSLADSVARIESMVALQGQQIREIRQDAAVTHTMFADRLSEHGDRIERLYDRTATMPDKC